MNFTKPKIEILLPPLIGDCVMTFPLINELNNFYNITLVCTEYTFEFIRFVQNSLHVKNIDELSNTKHVTIDFLSDEISYNYLIHSKPKISIGFPDGKYNYNLFLKQPKDFVCNQASEIFLYALDLLKLSQPSFFDFSFSKTWFFSKQESILIAPGAGNLDRCFEISSFVELAKHLSVTYKVYFILGPSEQHLAKFINNKYKIIHTNNIERTLCNISKARMLIVSEGGFMHLAAAYGIPLIGLFKIASIKNWFPYSNNLQVAIGNSVNDYHNIKCIVDFPLNEIISKTREIYENIRN